MASSRHVVRWDSSLGAASREKEQFPEAVAEYESAQHAAGDVPLYGYAVMVARAGQTAKARAILQRLIAYGRDHCINPISMTAVYASSGEKDPAFAWLGRTVRNGQRSTPYAPPLPERR